jgi:hypothetical protein
MSEGGGWGSAAFFRERSVERFDTRPDDEHQKLKLMRRLGASEPAEYLMALRMMRTSGIKFDKLEDWVWEQTRFDGFSHGPGTGPVRPGLRLKQLGKLGHPDENVAIAALMSLRENIDFNDLVEVVKKKTVDIEKIQEQHAQELQAMWDQATTEAQAENDARIEQTLAAAGSVTPDLLMAAQKLLELHHDGIIFLRTTEPYNELKFVEDQIRLLGWGTPLSPKQDNWLRRLCAKAGLNP